MTCVVVFVYLVEFSQRFSVREAYANRLSALSLSDHKCTTVVADIAAPQSPKASQFPLHILDIHLNGDLFLGVSVN